mgnify:FL=1
MEFWTRIDSIIEENSLLKHPFYQAWSMGRLTREDLRFYAGQYYHQESRFPTFLSAVHSRCPDLKTRQALLQNLVEEESGEENHPELWLRFAEGVGADRGQTAKAGAEAETASCVGAFEEITRQGHWTEGLAAVYAYEVQQPRVAQTKLDGLGRFYGVSGGPATAFFEVHRELDAWHSKSEKGILDDAIAADPSLKEGVEKAVRRSSRALWTLLDGVSRVRGIEACPA